jgi:probable rRNA maturation factor
MKNISFNFLNLTTLTQRNQLRDFIILLAQKEKRNVGYLNFIFCSDAYLLEINKTYLSHNYFTDIITFSYADSSTSFLEGDIYISIDTVKDNARRFKTSFKMELHRVIFHGVLHLCGFNDKNKKDQLLMTEKENEYLALYFPNL